MLILIPILIPILESQRLNLTPLSTVCRKRGPSATIAVGQKVCVCVYVCVCVRGCVYVCERGAVCGRVCA